MTSPRKSCGSSIRSSAETFRLLILGIGLTLGCQQEQPAEPGPATGTPSRPFIELAPKPPAVEDLREVEPNNDRVTASPVKPQESITGSISPPDEAGEPDQDWFAVEVPPGSPLLASVTLEGADDLDLVLEWMTREPGKDELRIQADHHVKSPGPEVLPNLRLEPGTTFFRVREAWYRGKPRRGSRIDYRLHVDTSRWSPTIESEPNATLSKAAFGSVGQTASGVLSHARDTDLWRFNVPALLSTERLSVEVTPPAGVTTQVSVAWSAEPQLSLRHTPSPGRPAVFRNLYPPDASSELLVKLKSSGVTSPSSPYQINTRLEADQAPETEREPNNTRGNASPMSVNGRVVGSLSHPSDHDVYRFQLDSDSLVTFTGLAPDGCLLTIGITDSKSRQLGTLTASSQPTEGENLSLFLRAGQHSLHIEGSDSCQSDNYEVKTTSRALRADEERERNDQPDDSAVITLVEGISHRGWLFPATDIDWWRLDLSNGSEGRITTIQFDMKPGMALGVTLVNSEGTTVVEKRTFSPTGPSTLTHFLPAGLYRLKVEHAEIDDQTGMQEYAVRVLKP